MKLTIGISAYNAQEYLIPLLQSIKNTVSLDHEIIIVDDASTDDTVTWLQANYPMIRLIINQENRGLAVNYAHILELAQGEYIFRLDADTQVQPECTKQLIEFLDTHPQVGVIAPQIVFPDGKVDLHSYGLDTVGVWQSFKDFTFLYWKAWDQIVKRWKSPKIPDEPIRVDHVLGAAFMVRKRIISEIGLPDVRVNFFRDETDWQYKIKERGWQIWYHPHASIVHVGGSSAGNMYIHGKSRNLASMWQFIHNQYPGFGWSVLFYTAIITASSASLGLGIILRLLGIGMPYVKNIGSKTIRTFWNVIIWHIQHISVVTNYSTL
jgi:GT2 family glycosyltransferase